MAWFRWGRRSPERQPEGTTITETPAPEGGTPLDRLFALETDAPFIRALMEQGVETAEQMRAMDGRDLRRKVAVALGKSPNDFDVIERARRLAEAADVYRGEGQSRPVDAVPFDLPIVEERGDNEEAA